jgi:hypothetical protein
MQRRSFDGMVINVNFSMEMEQFGYVAKYAGAVILTPAQADFIPYDDLTPEIVKKWVVDALGQTQVKEIEKQLMIDIENQKRPKVLNGVPWQQ